MLELRITIARNDARRLEEAADEAIQAVARVIEASVLKIDREIKHLIDRTPKSGRVYIRKGKPHQASAPGEPPATDTGGLIRSISWHTFNRGLSAEIGSSIFYAPFLEEGTSKMEPRPWLQPAYERHVDEIVDDITNTLKQYLS